MFTRLFLHLGNSLRWLGSCEIISHVPGWQYLQHRRGTRGFVPGARGVWIGDGVLVRGKSVYCSRFFTDCRNPMLAGVEHPCSLPAQVDNVAAGRARASCALGSGCHRDACHAVHTSLALPPASLHLCQPGLCPHPPALCFVCPAVCASPAACLPAPIHRPSTPPQAILVRPRKSCRSSAGTPKSLWWSKSLTSAPAGMSQRACSPTSRYYRFIN